METLLFIIGLLIGAALGIAGGWFVRSGRAGKEQADQRAEIARLNGQLEQTATTRQLLEQAQQPVVKVAGSGST